MTTQNIPPADLTLTAPAATGSSVRTVEASRISFGNAFNYFDVPTPMFIQHQEEIFRTPATLIATLDVAPAGATVDWRIDGLLVATSVVSPDGSSGPISLEVPESNRGAHTYSATVNGVTVFAGFYIQRDPRTPIIPDVPDADPEVVDGMVTATDVQRWVLQDLAPGGLGSWVMPANPRAMQPIPMTYAVDARHTTSVANGQFHLAEPEPPPMPWSFNGYCPNQQFYDQLMAYGQINRRFYLIDHRNRAWTVTFDAVEMVSRHRQKLDDGTYNDWAADYTVRAVIYDRSFKTPVVPV